MLRLNYELRDANRCQFICTSQQALLHSFSSNGANTNFTLDLEIKPRRVIHAKRSEIEKIERWTELDERRRYVQQKSV